MSPAGGQHAAQDGAADHSDPLHSADPGHALDPGRLIRCDVGDVCLSGGWYRRQSCAESDPAQ